MSEIVDLVLEDARDRMARAVAHARSEFSGVRSGRAAPQLVERITVEAYGAEMRVLEIAHVSVPEARQLLITPHDPGVLTSIEKAIRNSDLGLSPSSDGRSIRLNFPPLTEERRRELVRIVKGMAEDGRVAIRHVRREARKDLDTAEKDSDLSADEQQRASKELDGLTHRFEAEIDAALAAKEQELLEV
jgi:ribosome recycling factor